MADCAPLLALPLQPPGAAVDVRQAESPEASAEKAADPGHARPGPGGETDGDARPLPEGAPRDAGGGKLHAAAHFPRRVPRDAARQVRGAPAQAGRPAPVLVGPVGRRVAQRYPRGERRSPPPGGGLHSGDLARAHSLARAAADRRRLRSLLQRRRVHRSARRGGRVGPPLPERARGGGGDRMRR